MTAILKRAIPILFVKIPNVPDYVWVFLLLYTAVLSYGYGQKSAIAHQLEFATSVTAPLPPLTGKDLPHRADKD
jgi:hypothetical protein